MGPLNTKLAAMRAEKAAKRPAEITAIMDGATEALRASGIMTGIPGPGDRAPMFARPDVDGQTVRSRALLKRGPLVVSFFRGRW